MAHGSQDYFTSIDIRNQDLAQLINRNKFGTPQVYEGSNTIATGGTLTVLTLSGRGVVYFGVVYIEDTAGATSDKCFLVVDGVTLGSLNVGQLFTANIVQPSLTPVYVIRYDNTNKLWTFGISPNVTFETSFVVKFYNTKDSAQTVYYSIYCATI